MSRTGLCIKLRSSHDIWCDRVRDDSACCHECLQYQGRGPGHNQPIRGRERSRLTNQRKGGRQITRRYADRKRDNCHRLRHNNVTIFCITTLFGFQFFCEARSLCRHLCPSHCLSRGLVLGNIDPQYLCLVTRSMSRLCDGIGTDDAADV